MLTEYSVYSGIEMGNRQTKNSHDLRCTDTNFIERFSSGMNDNSSREKTCYCSSSTCPKARNHETTTLIQGKATM